MTILVSCFRCVDTLDKAAGFCDAAGMNDFELGLLFGIGFGLLAGFLIHVQLEYRRKIAEIQRELKRTEKRG